ncbi:hypothetical protein [Desulfonatronum parangueonense]
MQKLTFDFLIASIQDMQSTIRSIDTKLVAIIIFLILPLTQPQVYPLFWLVWSNSETNSKILLAILVIIFFLFWISALISSLLGLGSISNPAMVTSGTDKLKGSFYLGGMYSFKLRNRFFSSFPLKSNLTIDQCIENLNDDDLLIKEVVFEQMKLAYIRDRKILHQKTAYACIAGKLIIGFFIIIILIKGYIS